MHRALISVSDKTGILDFARLLHGLGIEILSTGGTLKTLKAGGIPTTPVESFTGFPEILEGRVKTLHPKIHGGLLYRRDRSTHVQEAKKHGIQPIDLVIVNLYPFKQVVEARPAVSLEEAIENIDIGGPSMLRSAAKNFDAVTVICDPADYEEIAGELKEHSGKISEKSRKRLALKVFERTAAYDKAIAAYLRSEPNYDQGSKLARPIPGEEALPLPDQLSFSLIKANDLRYGENPHQRSALYFPLSAVKPAFETLHGKELSYNNFLDIEAASDVLLEFPKPAACVIKHSNPCGIAEAPSISEALDKAIECDLMSAFGGIVGVNQPCDLETAKLAFDRLSFFEVFVAPSFEPAALRLLKTRKNLRLIAFTDGLDASLMKKPWDIKFLRTGILLQDKNLPLGNSGKMKSKIHFVTKIKLEEKEMEPLLFAWRCVKQVKSNAIVLTQGFQTVGIGAGQMSRVDSVDIACRKAGYRTDGAFLASDAFFPMPDSIEIAADHKIRAIIQPGGSLRDADVIAACDRFGIAMAFTGERHFRH
ncbi:MAG: bifunctional phosphoribosylaminoimidazolecarboxamide formyltransferase/IMP cyclohydrolase [Candidatus Omnitrophica bacterium]|nr:bifunctional phosphoribosylaminoimidazolecarboxamide formyltransferase/IMP cyclohydrolase [Candidatus Omnitrophota bacterium]